MSHVRRCPYCLKSGWLSDGVSVIQVVHCPGCGVEVEVAELEPSELEGEEAIVGEFEPVATIDGGYESTKEGGISDLTGGAGSVEPPSATDLIAQFGNDLAISTKERVSDPQVDEVQQTNLHSAEPGEATTDISALLARVVGESHLGSGGETVSEEFGAGAAVESFPPSDQELMVGPVFLLCPLCGGKFDVSECRLPETGDPLGGQAAQALSQILRRSPYPSTEGVSVATWPGVGPADQMGIQIAVPEEEARRRPFARQPQRKKNIFKELLSWVGGGILGLVIAYYLIVLIRGDHGNFLKLPLPGIKSSYKYSPNWFPGFLKVGRESSNQAAETGEEENQQGSASE